MNSVRVEFEGAMGDALAARMESPDGEARAVAVFAHCFTCGKDVVAASRISRALAKRGVATLRFDFTGLGGSDGDFANTDFSSNVDDLVAAARYLEREWDAPSLLVGHSLGGAAAIRAASQLDSVCAVVTIAAPFDPAHLTDLLGDAADRVETQGEAEVSIAGRTFTLTKDFFDDLRSADTAVIGELGRPLLVMHSPVDNVVSIDNAGLIFKAAQHPKSFVSLDGADHLLTDRADAEFVADLVAVWAARYICDGSSHTG